ncbi:MAG: hypothetical protein ABI602_00570 [Candidatus Saccharibacteria bacterium]
MAKHKIFLMTFIAVLIFALGLYVTKTAFVNNGKSEADVKSKLIAMYHPGTCYGMPGGQNEPDITLSKTSEGWKYQVKDGSCCDITNYEGTVINKSFTIVESKSTYSRVPC